MQTRYATTHNHTRFFLDAHSHPSAHHAHRISALSPHHTPIDEGVEYNTRLPPRIRSRRNLAPMREARSTRAENLPHRRENTLPHEHGTTTTATLP